MGEKGSEEKTHNDMMLTAKIDKKSGCMGTWEPIDGVIKDVVGFARCLRGVGAQLAHSRPHPDG